MIDPSTLSKRDQVRLAVKVAAKAEQIRNENPGMGLRESLRQAKIVLDVQR